MNNCESTLVYVPKRLYITSIAEEIKIILNHRNSFNKSEDYNLLKFVYSKSLFTAEAAEWKRSRKIISFPLNQNALVSFVDIFYEKSCSLVETLKNKDFDCHDIYHTFGFFIADVFIVANFGIEEDLNMDFVKLISEGQRIITNRVANIFKWNDYLFSLTSEGKRTTDNKMVAMKLIDKCIKQRRNEKKYLNGEKLCLLDHLINEVEKNNLDEEYIKEEILFVASAAMDATAYSLAYTLCLLGIYPEIQNKVHDEVTKIVGDNKITYKTATQLKYTEMVINESLRLMPTVPFIGRKTSDDLNLGNVVVPPNTNMLVNFFALHRNPKYYPDPTRFDPERFSPEEIAKRPQYTFLPFSGGPRNCLGSKYSSLLTITAIANVIRHFQVTTKYKSFDELEFDYNIVLVTPEPLDLHFNLR
ncbi:cytochrome P450 4C1-like [Aethina tumida]|uniref:cytochrome P450 4C1-like n=1 Tax=Aethina tumida TaxID=116153 RepID=UPI0021474EC5|nr:cytochrome P450 4C1-like [Aethina tumida]